MNNENYLKDGENTIDISRYVNEYIYTSDDYIKFKNDKIFILENLLNNVKSFDQEGNVVNIKLSVEQKDIVLKQYAESFETNIKDYIENNPDEFEDLFIANNTSQFEKLFPKTYVESLKEQAVSRFKNENVMEAVRYGLAYPDNMKSAMTRQFVNNDKYKTLLVFNNNKNAHFSRQSSARCRLFALCAPPMTIIASHIPAREVASLCLLDVAPHIVSNILKFVHLFFNIFSAKM